VLVENNAVRRLPLETPDTCPGTAYAVSLFSGCGGLDLGMQWAGFKTRLAVELDQCTSKSYRVNFGDAQVDVGRVEDVSETRLKESAGNGDIDLVFGGPPCPPFSKSRFYRADKPRGIDDPLAKSTLGGYLRVIRAIQPRMFLFENVKGFAYKPHRPALDWLVTSAKELGYEVSWRVLNAADFGVPQIRERFILVGSKVGEFDWPEPTHCATGDGGTGPRPWVTAGEAIGDLPTAEVSAIPGHFAGGKHHELLKAVPPGANYLYFTAKRGYPAPIFKWRSRYWSFLLKLSPDMPSWTIQARRSNNMGPFHWQSRILTVREVARLQTFPDEFLLCGTAEQQWRQIGNAVPPLLAERLGHSLMSKLRREVARRVS
jgi:DNA (cytosine-5)-methyltransferase 1